MISDEKHKSPNQVNKRIKICVVINFAVLNCLCLVFRRDATRQLIKLDLG